MAPMGPGIGSMRMVPPESGWVGDAPDHLSRRVFRFAIVTTMVIASVGPGAASGPSGAATVGAFGRLA